MRIELNERRKSFVSRPQGDEMAAELVRDRTDDVLTLSFADVYASPSFISSLLAGLDGSFTQIRVVSARERIAQMVRQIAERQGVGDIVTVEDVVTA